MLPRAAVLLLALTTLVPAAPAPLARRERQTAEERSWSKPVDGLRVRLVAPKARYRLGESVRLVLELQNVSGEPLAIEEPELSRYISEPHGKQHGWAVTAERVVDRRHGRVRMRQHIQDARHLGEVVTLAAGKTLRIEIEASTSRGEEKQGEAKEQQKQVDEPRQAELHFLDADSAVVYELRATFTGDSQERDTVWRRGWAGQALTSPPVRIELGD